MYRPQELINSMGCLCTPGRLPGLTGKFQQVAILGPADFIGEVVASKHKFTALAECECHLLWLKPQELHMLGSKSLGLAMQYNGLREKRWQQQQKQASSLPDMRRMPADEKGRSSSRDPAVGRRYQIPLACTMTVEVVNVNGIIRSPHTVANVDGNKLTSCT